MKRYLFLILLLFSFNCYARDCYLDNIRIDGKSISDFEGNKFDYDIETNNKSVKIDAYIKDSGCIVDGDGIFELKKGINKFTISSKCDSEEVLVKYNINVNYKEILKDSDSSLKSLELFNGDSKIDFDFKKNVFVYDLNDVEFPVLTIKATLNSNKSKFYDDFSDFKYDLEYGNNEIIISCIAEDESVSEYKIYVNRVDNRSNDNSLTFLSVNGKEISLKDNVFDYDITVRYNVIDSNIIAIGNNSSKVNYKNIKLVDGDNKVVIQVTSEKGIIKNYSVIIKRLSEDNSKVLFKGIKIKDYDLDFDINKTNYELKINSDVTSLEFVFDPKDEVRYDVINNENLSDGSVIIVRCIDDENEYRYTINIIKESNNNIIYVILGIIVGILVICATIVCVLIVKKKKK